LAIGIILIEDSGSVPAIVAIWATI